LAGLRLGCVYVLASLALSSDAAVAGALAALDGCLPVLAAAEAAEDGSDVARVAGEALANLSRLCPHPWAAERAASSGLLAAPGPAAAAGDRLHRFLAHARPAAFALIGAAVVLPMLFRLPATARVALPVAVAGAVLWHQHGAAH
jgi:hypothetical protein